MITINRNILFPSIWILSLMVSIISFFNTSNYFLSFLTFIYLVTVPGYLILLCLRIGLKNLWDKLILSVGLSLFFLIFAGVFFNWLWAAINKSEPLRTELLVIYFGTLTVIFINIAYFRNANFQWNINLSPTFLRIKYFYFILPVLVTIISIFAAILLNNGGNNILALVTLSGIALTFLCTVFHYKKINENFFPWSLYFFSLSLLLLLSLRSNYVSGWDIQNEFKLFQLTDKLSFWSPANWRSAYNACLSITVLPTIFSKLTSFPADYIYKLFYQVLFALTPVILFQSFKRYASPVVVYIAMIYIVSQPLFIQPMTALMRQEIAYIFFALTLYALFNSEFTPKIRSFLFIVFSFSMVVSHYSTTYITLLLLLGIYPLRVLFQLLSKIPLIENLLTKIKLTDKNTSYSYFLHPLLLLLLFGFTFFWYGYVNNQLGQVQQVATEGLSKMSQLFKTEVSNDESKKAITFLAKNYTTIDQIESYTNQVLTRIGGDKYKLYPTKAYESSNVRPMTYAFVIPLFISKINTYIIYGFEILKQILKVCVLLGPLYLFIFYYRKNQYPREYIILGGMAVLLIVVMTFHPSLGRHYNLSRFYLQLLFFLALPAVTLTLFMFSSLKSYALYISSIVMSGLFIYLLGLPYQFLGGEARMYLNNYGADYDKFYVHKEELKSAEWLNNNIENSATIFADPESNLRIIRIVDRSINYNVLPALIYQDAYVYGSYANIVNNRTSIYTDGTILLFSFPQQFLEKNKNVVYSNGGSKIYR